MGIEDSTALIPFGVKGRMLRYDCDGFSSVWDGLGRMGPDMPKVYTMDMSDGRIMI